MNRVKSLTKTIRTLKPVSISGSPARSLSSITATNLRPHSRKPTPTHITITPQTTAKMSTVSANSVLDNIKARRTYYPLSKDLTISKERVQEIVKEALLHVPSSFNSQSNRVLVLFGDEHDKLWDIATEILKGVVPEENWKHTGDRMAWFKGGAGTILFFEDQNVVNGMQEKFPLYSDKFPIWAMQSDAMLQFTLWTALEAEGLGANLQHYNPLIDSRVASEWKIPDNWKLNAQLVFGGKTGEAGPKDFMPIEERFKVFGA